jgi:RHS repeat-associated protein
MMVGGVTTRYVYDAAGQVLLEEVGNSISSVYTWGVDGLVRKDGEYPLVDGLGSERVVTNGSQGVTASVTYDAFGNVVARSGSSSDPYQFAGSSGYRNDGDAGLTYVGARYYDAQVGRFITRDTYLDQKPYLYCEHDPVNSLDPDGHKPKRHHPRRPPHKKHPPARKQLPMPWYVPDEITFHISLGPKEWVIGVGMDVKYDMHRIWRDLPYPIQKDIIQNPSHLKDDLRKVLHL